MCSNFLGSLLIFGILICSSSAWGMAGKSVQIKDLNEEQRQQFENILFQVSGYDYLSLRIGSPGDLDAKPTGNICVDPIGGGFIYTRGECAPYMLTNFVFQFTRIRGDLGFQFFAGRYKEKLAIVKRVEFTDECKIKALVLPIRDMANSVERSLPFRSMQFSIRNQNLSEEREIASLLFLDQQPISIVANSPGTYQTLKRIFQALQDELDRQKLCEVKK